MDAEQTAAKDPGILDVLARLRSALGVDAFEIVDHWPSDPMAIGIACPRNRQVLVYLAAFEDGYYAELELPSDLGDEFPYRVASRHSSLSFSELVDTVKGHLALG